MRISDWSSDVCSSDLIPLGHGLDVRLADRGAAVLVAQQVLQQDLHRIGQAGDVELLAQLGQAGVGVGLAVDVQFGAGGEGIAHGATSPVAGGGKTLAGWPEGAGTRHCKIGRASCRERSCLFVYIWLVALLFKKKT